MKSYPSFEKMCRLNALREGDVVDIVAPAWRCKMSEVNSALRLLKSWGLRPRFDKNMFGPHPLFANSDALRFELLKKSLMARDSRAIWCVRGGYGALRLLPRLEKLNRPDHTKIFIGYSDITTLHSFLNSRWRWPTWHGPLLDRLGRGEHKLKALKELKSALFGEIEHVELEGLKSLNKAARRRQLIRSQVVGGNMATLQSSMGTPWAVSGKGCIVFFEDIGERPHRVDRMLTQMQQAGYFKGVRAVVFGDLLLGTLRDKKLMFADVLPRFAASVSFPVFSGLPAGHGEEQRLVPFGTRALLEVSTRNASLILATGIRE